MQRGVSSGRASGWWRFAIPSGMRGYSLIEVMVTLTIAAGLIAIAVPRWNASRMNILTARRMVLANLRLARTNAITKFVHYQVSFPDTGHVALSRMLQSTDGSGTWAADTTKVQTSALPASTQVTGSSQAINVEFNTRGMVVNPTPGPTPVQINLSDTFSNTKSLQVWPSGQVNEK
jgi:prepilin-type N-terminal cleavage/methylation domain-containing protein